MTISNSSTATATATAIVLGATGAVGKPLLATLLAPGSPFSQIHSFVRTARAPPTPAPASQAPAQTFAEHVIDFEALASGSAHEADKLRAVQADVVFITLGTTRAAAGGAKQFERIDRDYVLAAARAAARPGARVVYCSSQAATSSSSFLYPKSKGLTEEGLAALYDDALIFRPGFLKNAQRPQTRILEAVFGRLTGLLSRFTDSLEIPVDTLARAMVKAGHLGSEGLKNAGVGNSPQPSFKLDPQHKGTVTVVANAEALKLGADKPE